MPDHTNALPLELLSTPPPRVGAAEAERVALELFGIRGKARALDGERDRNFRLVTAEDDTLVLKFAHPLEQKEAIDLQCAVLEHIARHTPTLPLPRVVRTMEDTRCAGFVLEEGRGSTIRALTYLPGVTLDRVPCTNALREALGRLLARLDRALREFQHDGAKPDLLWDLAAADRTASLVSYVGEDSLRTLLCRHYEDFPAQVKPRLSTLRSQFIYNDLNGGNVLVDDGATQVIGIIDFGDLAWGPRVADVAVAATYQLRHTEDPLVGAIDLVRGYHAIETLTADELDLLPALVRMRLVLALTITAWRAALFPDNRDYILRNASSNVDLLRTLDAQHEVAMKKRLHDACELPSRSR